MIHPDRLPASQRLAHLRGVFMRTEDLRQVGRFATTPDVLHRMDVFTHAERVRIFCSYGAPYLRRNGVNIDPLRVEALARHHDDPEIITNDIPSPVKRAMSPEEREYLHAIERTAMEELADRYSPAINHDKYMSAFEETSAKKTTESHLVTVADKWDGICETIHEIRCGNDNFGPKYENYREMIGELNFPILAALNRNRVFCMDDLPPVEDIMNLQPIRLESFHESSEKFWDEVMDPDVPLFYRLWQEISLVHFHTRGTAMFPGWKKELGNSRPQMNLQALQLLQNE